MNLFTKLKCGVFGQENGFRSETFLGISGSVTTIIRSSLQHTTDRSINSRFSIIVVALRCRRGTAIARVINTERVDTRGSVKRQLHSRTNDDLVVRKLIV